MPARTRGAGSKRKQSPKSAPKQTAPPAKQPKQEGQRAVSHDIEVPVDEGFYQAGVKPSVFIDDGGIIFDASLNQTQIGRNANKVYPPWSQTYWLDRDSRNLAASSTASK